MCGLICVATNSRYLAVDDSHAVNRTYFMYYKCTCRVYHVNNVQKEFRIVANNIQPLNATTYMSDLSKSKAQYTLPVCTARDHG